MNERVEMHVLLLMSSLLLLMTGSVYGLLECYPKDALPNEYGKYYHILYNYAGLEPETAWTTCRLTCFEEKFTYHGIMRSRSHNDRVQCYCGNSTRMAPVDSTYCNMRCEGGRQCGGNTQLQPYITVDQDPDRCLYRGLPVCREKLCIGTYSSYKCVTSCGQGYLPSADRHRCKDVNECADGGSDVCRSDQLCINNMGSYKCIDCIAGYKPSSAHTRCVDTDECASDNGGCDQNCHNYIGGYNCTCEHGYALQQGHECIDLDECTDDNGGCEQICINTNGSFYCSCNQGYTLRGDVICVASEAASAQVPTDTGMSHLMFSTILAVACTVIGILVTVVVVGAIFFVRKHRRVREVHQIQDVYLTTNTTKQSGADTKYENIGASCQNLYEEITDSSPARVKPHNNREYLCLKESLKGETGQPHLPTTPDNEQHDDPDSHYIHPIGNLLHPNSTQTRQEQTNKLLGRMSGNSQDSPSELAETQLPVNIPKIVVHEPAKTVLTKRKSL